MRKSSRKILGGILIVAVLLRVAVALYLGDQVVDLPGTSDQLSYHTLALRVLDGQGFTFEQPWWPLTAAGAPTAHWSYLYTFFLMAVYTVFGPHPLAARLIQAVLVGLLQPYLAYRLGRHAIDDRVGLAAAGATAIYAYFVYYAGALMTEPFYITAILGSFYLAMFLVQSHQQENHFLEMKNFWLALALGLTLGVTVLLRQLFLLFIPFLFLWIWWSSSKKKITGYLALAGILLVLLILPFTIYNAARFNRFVLLNTNAGYAFFWGNHPVYGTHFEPILPPELGNYQQLIPVELSKLDEAALDQALLQRGIQFIKDDPVRYVLLSISRIPAFFMFWPSSDSSLVSNLSRLLSFGLAWPFMLYGLVRAFSQRWSTFRNGLASPAMLLILFTLVYTTIHLLSWALIRYRLPVDAVLLIFAGLAIVDSVEQLGRRLQQARAAS